MLLGDVLLNLPWMTYVINVPLKTAGIPRDKKSSDLDPIKFPPAMELFSMATVDELIGGGGANSIFEEEF